MKTFLKQLENYNMFKKLIERLKRYFPSKEISDDIHRKNRDSLARIFIFSFLFGVIFCVVKLSGSSLTHLSLFYYASYVFFGITGFILCKTKSGKYTPTVFCLLSFSLIFLYYARTVPFTKALVYFIGFIVAVEILMNLNPVVLSAGVIVFEILVILMIYYGKASVNFTYKENSILNMIFLTAIIIYISFWKRRGIINKYETEKEIELEKQKSEELLLNVLPQNIMEQLRSKGNVEPEAFENTSVLFCQVVNYVELSARLGPEKLVNELNDVFSVFDDIAEKNSCTRIKTMGEIYMAVCGLPEPDPHHAEHSVSCAKDFVEYIQKYNETSDVQLQVRAGVSSGSVIAGIVGIKKYIYDIFGDTVNTAYRMKDLSSAMQVKVSPMTYELVKDDFEFVKQNPIEVKGKGQMETYNLDI